MDEFRDPDFYLGTISEEKSNIAFVYENTQRYMIPSLEYMVGMYEGEVRGFQQFTDRLTIIMVVINSSLLCCICWFVMGAVATVFRRLEYKLVAVSLAMSLPHRGVVSIYKHYDQVEQSMKERFDEEAERQAIIEEADQAEGHNLDSPLRSPRASVAPGNSAGNEELFAKQVLQNMLQNGYTTAEMNRIDEEEEDSGEGLPTAVKAVTAGPVLEATLEEDPWGVPSPSRPKLIQKEPVVFSAVNLKQAEIKVAPVASGERNVVAVRGQIKSALRNTETSFPKEYEQEEEEEELAPLAAMDNADVVLIGNEVEVESESRSKGASPVPGLPTAEDEDDDDESVEMPSKFAKLSANADRAVVKMKKKSASLELGESDENEGDTKPIGFHQDEAFGTSMVSFSEEENLSVTRWELLVKGLLKSDTSKFIRGIERTSSFKGNPDQRKPATRSPARSPQRASSEGTAEGSGRSFQSAILKSVSNLMPQFQSKSHHHVLKGMSAPSKNNLEADEVINVLEETLARRKGWKNQPITYVFATAAVLVLCVMSIIWPARTTSILADLAATTNQAGRRRYLVRSCVHYTRELVLNDGYSRMDRIELSTALRFYLQEFKDAHKAVRLGGDKNISVGADDRSELHNSIMYDAGCPWREDPTDCSYVDGKKADVMKHGLQYLVNSFIDAVEKVIVRYGSHELTDTWREPADLGERSRMYQNVTQSAANKAILTSDPEVKFISDAFAGDVFNGLGATLSVFHAETDNVLSQTRLEIRLFTLAYITFLILGFYYYLFRSTLFNNLTHAKKAKQFVHSLPAHTMHTDDVQSIVEYFVGVEKFQEDHY